MDMLASAKSAEKPEYKPEYKAEYRAEYKPEYKIKNKTIYSIVKRIFDFTFSLLALVLLIPVFVIIAIAIKLDDGGPVFYVSDRVGKNGTPFKFYKFRSMYVNADEIYEKIKQTNETGGPTFKMKDDPRVTKSGKFLRKTSLDELPQLFNVLKGDMSLVGPRPPLLREVNNYNDYLMQRLTVPGGLTCYWQISGRSAIDFDGMVELDLKYIEERGILTDLKILFLTIPAVLKGDGAY